MPQKSWRQKGDMKQDPYCGPTAVQWPVSLAVIWRFLLGACEMVHIFVLKGKPVIIVLKIWGKNKNSVAMNLCIPA
jgi:hypothetical protein